MKYSSLLLAALFLPSLGMAHTPYTMPECQQFGRMVEIVAENRDKGLVAAITRDLTLKVMTYYVDYPKFFVKDETDVDMVLAVIPEVYAHPELVPAALAALGYNECVKVLIPGLLTRKKL